MAIWKRFGLLRAGHVMEVVPVQAASESSGRPRRRLFALSVACAGIAFVALAILAHRIAYFPIDVMITRQVQDARVAWIEPLLRPLNLLGFTPLVGIVYGSIIGVILVAGARLEAVVLGVTTLGAAGLNYLVKDIVARPRPPMELVHVAHHLAGSGFPAGHVLNFTAFAGLLGYLAWVRLSASWPRTALIACLLVAIALMGIARIYAGEHWASDVLGGYLLGSVWLGTTIELYRWGRRGSKRRAPSRTSVKLWGSRSPRPC